MRRAVSSRRLHTHAELLEGRVPKYFSNRVREVEIQRGTAASERMRSGPAFTRKNILYEDTTFFVVNKPAAILNQHVVATAAYLMGAPYVPTYPPQKYPASAAIGCYPQMINCLNRDTSGVNVLLKRYSTEPQAQDTFLTSAEIEKTYAARCAATCGKLPTFRRMRIQSGHGRSVAKTWWLYPIQEIGQFDHGCHGITEAITEFTVLGCRPGKDEGLQDGVEVVTVGETLRLRSDGDVPQVEKGSGGEVLLRTCLSLSRIDQIRLHLQYLGFPLLGDFKYGGPLEWNGVAYDHHALHVEALSFVHPTSGMDVRIEAPAPAWVNEFQARLAIAA